MKDDSIITFLELIGARSPSTEEMERANVRMGAVYLINELKRPKRRGPLTRLMNYHVLKAANRLLEAA